MSLLEVLVASGLIVTASLGLAQMMRSSGKASRGLALTNDFENLSVAISQVLKQEKSCKLFMQQMVVNRDAIPWDDPLTPGVVEGLNIGEVGYTDGPNSYTIAETSAVPAGLWIKRISMYRRPGADVDLGTLPNGSNVFMATLRVEAERRGGGQGGQTERLPGSPEIIKEFQVTIAADPAAPGAILNCFQDPRVSDLCTALGGTPNVAGTTCDISEVTCLNLNGTYNAGGTPQCTFGNNFGTGATSVTAMCAAMNGVLVPNGPGQKCDTCTPNGGWLDGAGSCHFGKQPCTDMGGVYDDATRRCNNLGQAMCIKMGGQWGQWNGAPGVDTCRFPHHKTDCTWTGDTGECDRGRGRGDFRNAGTVACDPGKYLADIQVFNRRETDGDVDSFCLRALCCKP